MSASIAEVEVTVLPAYRTLIASERGPVGRYLTRRGNRAVNLAKRAAPVATGYLRSRIDMQVQEEAGGLVLYVRARTPYAVYVLKGTRFMRGRPFLQDAVHEAFRGPA